MRIAESLRTKCANKQELAIVSLEELLSGSATARHDSGDDGQDGARHDDEWSPPIGIYTPAKLVFTVETFEHDDVEEEAWLRLRRGGSSVLTRRARGWRHGSDQTATAVLELNT
ncbi:hypothetical protein YC2023_054644 [Brassica napus]